MKKLSKSQTSALETLAFFGLGTKSRAMINKGAGKALVRKGLACSKEWFNSAIEGFVITEKGIEVHAQLIASGVITPIIRNK